MSYYLADKVKLKPVFLSCERPVMVTRDNQRFAVPCGKCAICLNDKSKMLRARLSQEVKDNRYTVFFTLTYNNKNVPFYRLDKDDNCYHLDTAKGIYLEDNTFRSYSEKEYVSVDKAGSYIPAIRNFDVSDAFGVVSRSDVQKFLKRLRYYLYSVIHRYYSLQFVYKHNTLLRSFGYDFKMSYASWLDDLDSETYNLYNDILFQYYNDYEKKKKSIKNRFRYFICSEYGPTGFRPHYHGLLFFDDETTAKFIKRCIFQAWTLCDKEFIDCQFVSGDAAGYVSKYVTGNTNLPKVLQLKPTHTFYLASKGPAIGYKSYGAEQLQECFHRGHIYESVVFFTKQGQQTDVYPISSSVVRRFFPKCKGYSHLSYTAKLRVYSRFCKSKRVGKKVVFDAVASKDCIKFYHEHFRLYNKYTVDEVGNPVIDVPADFSISDILAAFACYKWCSRFGCSVEHYVFMLDWFWYQIDQFHLYQQYRLQEQYTSSLRVLDGDVTWNYRMLGMDFTLLASLPRLYKDCMQNETLCDLLESYGCHFGFFYDEYGILNDDFVNSLFEYNQEHFKKFRNSVYDEIENSRKTKRANEHVLDNDNLCFTN